MEALHEEIAALIRKGPNDAVNKFKLSLINKVVQAANGLLGEKYKPFSDFELFDADSVPSTSDVTLVLAQYLNCMEIFRADNIIQDDMGDWKWRVSGQTIQTSAPRKLRGK